VSTNAFTLRMLASGLSRWELADLLGLHPHELDLADRTVSMNGQPVRVVAELAARLDMHPADLAGALEPVLGNRRALPGGLAAGENGADDVAADAVVVLTALATISVPLMLSAGEMSVANASGCQCTPACPRHQARLFRVVRVSGWSGPRTRR